MSKRERRLVMEEIEDDGTNQPGMFQSFGDGLSSGAGSAFKLIPTILITVGIIIAVVLVIALLI